MHPSQSYPRRPLREEYPGRFSDSPALSAAFPSLDNLMTVAINLLKGFPFSFQKRAGLQRRVRPRISPSKRRSRGSLPLDITDLNKFHLTNLKWYVKFYLPMGCATNLWVDISCHFLKTPLWKSGARGDFFEIFIHKISPNPSLPKRGRLWGLVTSKITDTSDCLITFRL